MTRLVGVRALCDGCCAAAAAVFCVNHRYVLCRQCDLDEHDTPSTKSHQRTDLSSAVTALPFCEHCDDAPATTYCENEGSTLCDKCDAIVHEVVEVPHWRTPIEKTLRSRAVEFRVSSRPRQTGRPRPSQAPVVNTSHAPNHSPEKRQREFPKAKPQNSTEPDPLRSTSSLTRKCRIPVSATCSVPPPAASTPTNQANASRSQQSLKQPQHARMITPSTAALPCAAPRHSMTHQRRRPRPLVKRKRDIQRSSEQVQNRLPDVPFSRTQVSPPDQFFADSPVVRTSQPIMYPLLVDASSLQPSQPQPLQEALLMDSDSRYLDLDVLSYKNLDISGEATAIEGISGSGKSASVSGSAAESGASSRRKTPDTDMPPYDARVSRNAPTQAALREVVASAVAVAGEQYLLNNASSGSGSSRESSPADILCPPDPAGLVAAATAAAASVVAQATAGVDLSNQELKGSPTPLTTDAMAEALTGRMRQPRNGRRMSDPGIPSARDLAKVEAAREAISDEAMRRLEIEARRSKHGDFMIVDGSEGEREKSEGYGNQLVEQMSDGDDVLRRGEEMVYLDMSRDDFGGVFDAIDLSQFEQSGSGGLGFGTGEFRAPLDSDEG